MIYCLAVSQRRGRDNSDILNSVSIIRVGGNGKRIGGAAYARSGGHFYLHIRALFYCCFPIAVVLGAVTHFHGAGLICTNVLGNAGTYPTLYTSDGTIRVQAQTAATTGKITVKALVVPFK